jgi:hypothetical protein
MRPGETWFWEWRGPDMRDSAWYYIDIPTVDTRVYFDADDRVVRRTVDDEDV